MPWWLGPAIGVAKALGDLISEAVTANAEKLEDLGRRAEAVLEEGKTAFKLAREAATNEDAQTKKARDEAIERIRKAASSSEGEKP
jgi:hypothetical protein